MCQTMRWKIQTVQIREIYNALICCERFPEELKGYRKGTKGKDNLQYIAQNITRESKIRWYGLTKKRPMIWSHKNCLKIYERLYGLTTKRPMIWSHNDCLKIYERWYGLTTKRQMIWSHKDCLKIYERGYGLTTKGL